MSRFWHEVLGLCDSRFFDTGGLQIHDRSNKIINVPSLGDAKVSVSPQGIEFHHITCISHNSITFKRIQISIGKAELLLRSPG